MARPVDELVDEYLNLPRGGRVPPRNRVEDVQGGAIEFCGADERATLTFVRQEKITLLAVGTREETVEAFEKMQRDHVRYADLQAAAAVWGGEPRGFRPLGSGRVLGAVEHGQGALLLGLVGKSCVVVEVRRRAVLCTSPWQQLGVVDLDAHLQLDSRKKRVEVCDQDVSDRICIALRSLAARATAPGDGRHRGKTAVRLFVDLLIVLGQAGCGDLTGRTSEIVLEIQRFLPDEVLCAKQIGQVLALLAKTGTVLVERPTPRTWRVRLAALQDPSSTIHRAVCMEVPRRRLAPSVAQQMARPLTAGEMLRSGDLEVDAPELRSGSLEVDALAPAGELRSGNLEVEAPVPSTPPARTWLTMPLGTLVARVVTRDRST
jgi:hypothetical protein